MLGFRARLDPVDVAVVDTMVRANQSGLGTTSDGLYTWNILTGTWSIASNLASTATAASSNPVAYIDPGYSDVDISLGISSGGNDAIYFRIVDANNWLRLKLREYTTSSTVTTYCNSVYYDRPNPGNTGCSGCPGQWGFTGTSGDCSTSACGGSCTTLCTYNFSSPCGNCGVSAPCNANSCTYACGTSTIYYYNYYLDLEKMVGGTLSQIANISLGQSVSVTQIRVVAVGSTIDAYCTETTGTEQLQGTYTDSTNSTATKHGIGRGSSNSTSGDSSAISNFRITLGE